MDRIWKLKLVTLIFAAVGALAYIAPSVLNLDPEKSSFPVKKKVNLGLDLQGGLYMIFGVDLKKVLTDAENRQIQALQTSLKVDNVEFKVTAGPTQEPMDPHSTLEFPNGGKEKALERMKAEMPQLLVVDNGATVDVALSWNYRKEIQDRTIAQSIQVIRNRIDEFGVTEPTIVSQGSDRLVVELPGVKDIERAKALVGRTAKLEFKMVDDRSSTAQQLGQLIEEIQKTNNLSYKDGERFSEYVEKLNGFAKSKIPEGTEIAFERKFASPGVEGARIPYLLFNKVEISGQDLADATVQYGEFGEPNVGFTLEHGAANTFANLTEKNVGHRMAIVLDGIIHSAPNIQGKIPGGRGQITLGRQSPEDSMKEAKDLAIVLRAGALPAQLDLLEQRSIGPSLGQDSINKGVRSGVIGCLLVFAFMMIYYRLSGVIATVSLVLNVLFVFAILILIDATLTLPGIAGLALTIGMAVDSNVIIFERIRDELKDGASVRRAVEHGFDRAFACIFDANITHGIVALILMQFGTGPIKGFAVTLLIGIFTTLFCAVTVAKLCFDGYLGPRNGSKEPKTLSI